MDNTRTIPGYKYFVSPATGARPAVCVAFLDAVEDVGPGVDGVAFAVSAARLEALDARERNYRRVEIGAALDVDLGAPVWAYLGREEARERFARAAAAGAAVVARAYVEHVRAGFAAHGLAFDTAPDVPVIDLTRVDVPV
jgi:hypothetical protein